MVTKLLGKISVSLTLLLCFFIFPEKSMAQTCCSGGVPIAANLGLPAGKIKTFQFTLNYDYNSLKTLKEGRLKLNDHTRERTTQSTLFGIGYSLSNKFSIDALLSYVKQVRVIAPPGLPKNMVTSRGPGDAVLLLKYNLLGTTNRLAQMFIGLGIKLPTGPADLKNNGITLNADLQPGSGAWDQILWTNLSGKLKVRPGSSYSITIIYRMTGVNDRYFGSQSYELGNEFQSIAGISDQFLLKNLIINPSLSARFRHAAKDINNADKLPNTGGSWVFLIPSVSLKITPKFSFNTALELPIYGKVEGVQLSPSFRINTGIHYTLTPVNKGKETFSPGE